ncbi:MAG: hypothetical protein D6721_08900 [Gammaproteobacteria bacterium]|nr:MAG: hypothetical protein D6721_08900 [Gammaproteobacteria bacterium]
MDEDFREFVKHREIWFRGPHALEDQAQAAALLLSDVLGVERVEPLTRERLAVSYDIRQVNLEALENLLRAEGFHLDNSLMAKMKRALWYYCDSCQQAQLGCHRGSRNCTQAVFVNTYRQRPHGCRDPRPEHWRKYL